MGIVLVLSKFVSSSSLTSSSHPLLNAIDGLPILDLTSICINLTLFLVFLFIVSAHQIFVCIGRVGIIKDDSRSNSHPIRRSCHVEIVYTARLWAGNFYDLCWFMPNQILNWLVFFFSVFSGVGNLGVGNRRCRMCLVLEKM